MDQLTAQLPVLHGGYAELHCCEQQLRVSYRRGGRDLWPQQRPSPGIDRWAAHRSPSLGRLGVCRSLDGQQMGLEVKG
jgi:hypothetical protein